MVLGVQMSSSGVGKVRTTLLGPISPISRARYVNSLGILLRSGKLGHSYLILDHVKYGSPEQPLDYGITLNVGCWRGSELILGPGKEPDQPVDLLVPSSRRELFNASGSLAASKLSLTLHTT